MRLILREMIFFVFIYYMNSLSTGILSYPEHSSSVRTLKIFSI